MEDFSEATIKKDCPHCDPTSFALKHPLEETKNFWVVCDVHPLCGGHVLIIPKIHLSCIGEYPSAIFEEFLALYTKFGAFVKKEYGAISTFEHGKIGQTVFHSHVHLLPYGGEVENVIAEGHDKCKEINALSDLYDIFKRDGQYLFFSIEEKLWIVDLALGQPRFFRDRFARVLGRGERGNWKEMHADETVMRMANGEIAALEKRWLEYKK